MKRSCPFDLEAEKSAKRRAKDRFSSYEFAFRKRYGLPPTDPRYLSATRDLMIEDYWLHFYAEHGVKDEVEDEDFNLDEVLESMESGDWEEVIRG